ncbi:PREDICTED: suppressor of cytokine signaling 2-like [Priapulus caudatus]|uniref:Suppressor of cytokine signaling 2-like n=1 Tax=Priapulus caudatus TaxID=37621 RepID=A0ABM1E7J0_PRICU|nr:PREDICTED: suppressor of cytokine signaling 2-like [Priapulus caudatus]
MVMSQTMSAIGVESETATLTAGEAVRDKDSGHIVLSSSSSSSSSSSVNQLSLTSYISLKSPIGWPDIKCLEREIELLQSSCDWYYGDLTWKQAHDTLKNSPLGTFLLRNSNNLDFLFSLSIKTRSGVVSVRIGYYKHRFAFDVDAPSGQQDSHFTATSVVGLVEREMSARHKHVFLWGTDCQQVVLTAPLRKRPSRLQHLCRVAVNRSLGGSQSPTSAAIERLPLPKLLRKYLEEYPHTV